MSTLQQQPENLRFITLRAGGQKFAMTSSSIVGALETLSMKPVANEQYPRAIGMANVEGKELPVFNLADWLGIKERRESGSAQSILVQGTSGRFVLQARDLSAAHTLPDGKSVSLPAPLDRLVGHQYLAILKWSTTTQDLREKQLTDRIMSWRSRKPEQPDELFLQLNHDAFLTSATPTSSQTQIDHIASITVDQTADQNSPSSGTSRDLSKTAKPRLMLFSPTPDTLADRPYLFGISASQVVEICRPMPVVPVPGANECVAGIVNWRGTIVPVLRMAEMVGLEGILPGQAQRLLIALTPNGRNLIGVQVLSAMRTEDLPIVNTPHPRSSEEIARYVHGSYELEHETLVMPNLNSMMQHA